MGAGRAGLLYDPRARSANAPRERARVCVLVRVVYRANRVESEQTQHARRAFAGDSGCWLVILVVWVAGCGLGVALPLPPNDRQTHTSYLSLNRAPLFPPQESIPV